MRSVHSSDFVSGRLKTVVNLSVWYNWQWW